MQIVPVDDSHEMSALLLYMEKINEISSICHLLILSRWFERLICLVSSQYEFVVLSCM